MPREKSKWRPPRGERTDAEHGDGPTRTSEEGRSCGRSKGVGPSGCLQRPTGNRRRPWRQRSRRLLGGSGVSREAPTPFCERPGVKLLRPTRPMFSDFKSRGFGLEDSQIRLPGRLDRLILVMALALFWAVSTGMWDAAHRPTRAEKTLPRQTPKLRPIPHLLVQARAPAHPHLPSSDDPPPTSLDRMAHPPN